MEHITAKKNRLMTMLLTILFSTVIFCCALVGGFGFGATAEEGEGAIATPKYELTTVSVSFHDDWIFTENTPDSALYKMVSVSVTYKDLDTNELNERVLEVSAYGTAATGESVAFVRDTTTKKVTVTVTTAGADYVPATVSGTSAAYTLSTATPVINGIIAFYDEPDDSDINTRTQPNTNAVKSNVRVYQTYSDGTNNNQTVSSFNLGGDLFPSTVTGDMTADSVYAKEIPVTSGAYSTTVLITGIKFIVPSEVVGIDGNFQTQMARSKQLNISDLSVYVSYRNPFKQFTVPAAAFPATCFSAKYTDAAGNEVVDASGKPVLTTSVKNVTLSFVFPDWNINDPVETTFEDIEVSRIPIHTPEFPDGINATSTTLSWNDGASLDMSGWDFDTLHTDTGDAPAPVISVYKVDTYGSETLIDESEVPVDDTVAGMRSVSFPTAGYLYRVKVTLPASGDFMWDAPFNGNKSDDNLIMMFDVQVDKGTPVVTLSSIGNTVYGTPNGSGTLKATIDDVEMGKTWSEVAEPDTDKYKDDKNAWHYRLSYYTDATATTPVPASNLRTDGRPKKGGTYYAVATSYENSGYESATSKPCMFKITPFTVNTTVADKTFARTDWTIDDILSAGNSFPYSESATSILTIKEGGVAIDATKKFRNANEYTVSVSVNEAANYQLSGAATVKFAIKTDTSSTFSFTVTGWTYGAGTANPNITVTSKSNPYYPSKTGTLNTDYTVKYYKFDSTQPNNKGAAVTIPQTSGSDDFSKLEVGGYVVELTAKKDAAYPTETAALSSGKTVDYTLPVEYQSFVVSASPIEAPQLSAPWDTTEANGGLLYTYDDTQSGQPFTFAKWIGDGANNTAADGSAIITVAISYTTFVTGDVKTLTLGLGGTFTVNEAGNYAVEVTLNKNYSWSTTAAWTPSDATYTYYGYVARQKLTVLTDGNISGTTNVYDSTAQEKTITGWNTNALKITSVGIAGFETGHTPVTGDDYITTPTDNGNKFGVTNAGIYTVEVGIDDQDNYEWDGATTDTEKLRTLSLNYTLYRAPMKVTWGTSNFNGTFDKTDITKYPRFEFDGGKAVQGTPAATVNVYAGDMVTIDAYTLYNDANGAFGGVITDVENVGYYRIVVSAISGAAAPNYYLPENGSGEITLIATVFEIYAKTFARPVLDATVGSASISGNAIEVVYRGNGYRLSDFIQDFGKYTLNDILRLEIECDDVSGNNPLLKNVLWDTDDTIKAYTVTVKPTDNYSWSTGAANETLTYTITITQKTVEIKWGTTGFQTTYGEVTEPTPIVNNKESGDTVTIDSLGYKKGNTAVADITAAEAGEYTVYAATLDNANYKIDTAQSDWSIPFTIKKKALVKPTLNAAQFKNIEFNGTSVSSALYSNSATEKAAWQTEDGMLFDATVTAKRDQAWFTETVDDSDAALNIVTTDTAKYAFNTATGILTYYAAGIYTVTFTLTDSANYCWAGDGNETAFTDVVDYTCAWGGSKELTVARKVIDAPALGDQRAMEAEKTYPALSTIFTGTTDGVAYGVKYGTRDGGGAFGAPQDAQPANNVRGQYYVLLTANDKYNYAWAVNADGEDGGFAKSSFITPQIDGKVYKIEYTVADGAKVYLLYAVTATQLDVVLVVNSYTYGDNGYAIGDTVIAASDKWVRDYANGNGDNKVFDYQNHHEHVGAGNDQGTGDDASLPEHNDPVYTFYKITGNSRVPVAEADLVEGLPWEAGEYEAEIVIDFDDADNYQQWTDTRKFTVQKREIILEWTFGGVTKQDGGEFTTQYNGAEQKPTYTITNVPKKTAGDDPTAPQLTFTATAVSGKVAFIDAAQYAVADVSFADSNIVNDDFALVTYSLGFEITPKEVTLTATAQNHTYGDSLTFAAGDCLTDETKAQFYERDGSVVTMRVQDATGTNVTDTLNVVYGGEYYLVPVFNTANSKRTNYTITATTKAALTVEKRAITVEVTNTPTSVYSEDIAAITYTVTRDGSAAGAIVDSEADVFSIAARDGSGNVITSLADVDDYYIILTLNSLRGGNYDVTFGTSQAADGETTIQNEGYKYSITPKQIAEDDNSIVANSLTYNGDEQNILQDGYAVIIGNPEIAGNAPVWSYFQTDSNYLTDEDTVFTPFTQSPTVKNAGKYYFVIKVTAANHTALTKNIEVTVGKAELTVKFDLTIMFGEENPASVSYMFGLDKLRTENSGWTVEGFESAADRALFYTAGANFYGLAGKAEYSVPDYDKDALTTSYDINFIAAEYDSPTLTCSNYTIVGEVGTLTVQKATLTVTINDNSVTYNEQNASLIPSVNVPVDGYTVLMPNSTYDVNTPYVMSEGSYAEIFTISTTAHDGKIVTSTTGNVGSYAISGTAILADKYDVIFVGGWDETLKETENGTCGKYTINPAALTVKTTIADYTGSYDEKWHGIVVDGDNTVQGNGDPTDGVVLATASDGTAVAVEYRTSNSQLGVLNKTEFEKLTLSATAPKYRDVGRYYVYYSLSNPNYTTVLDFRRVIITVADNELSEAFDFQNNSVVSQGDTIAKAAWTYGYKVENGFDPDGDNIVIEPEAMFKYASGNTLGKITFTLFWNESSIWTKTVDADAADTVTNMFAELFAGNGLSAGSYMLSVSMEGTANYNGFTTVYAFNVAKRDLTVKAATPDDIAYGSEIPVFTDASVGLVVNSSKAGATADSIADALDGTAPNYVTAYSQGDNADASYRVYVSGKADGATDANTFTNYAVTYQDVQLTVVARVITVQIADKENTYNLRGADGNNETIQTLTFTVTDGSIYTAELDGGAAPADGVYNNDNQTVLTLCTEAIVGDNTNNVKLDGGNVVGYTIYAEFYDGTAATNYQIKFAGCTLKEETENTAIGYDGSVNNAGSYTIKKAIFNVLQDGVYHNVGDDKIKGTVYSGAVNYYVATLDDQNKTRIDFTYTQKVDGNYVSIAADQVVNVGEYQAIGSSVNPNYTAANLTIVFEITKATLTLTANATRVQYGTTLSGNVTTDNAVGGVEATGRFDGFTYKSSSPTLLAETLSDYLEDNPVGYTISGYDASTRVGAACTITPACESDSNVNIIAVGAALTVIKREVTVTMVGWDEANSGDNSKHNEIAWCYYLGTHDATHNA
ncbi:MAG: hypothetical protein K2O39_02685, partial [Clostridiales bacterium]|nr:hypothetical protein [Clostridiales bacterium]